MKKYIKNYIGKGTENTSLYIIKVTLKMDQAEQFIYEKDGNRYLTFEVSQLKEADKFNRTHTCYVSRLQEETIPVASSLSTDNELPGADFPEFNPIIPEKVQKPRGKKEKVTA
ncbi:MAG: hypothetical protein V1775_00395 [Bacteroidota bacterium]